MTPKPTGEKSPVTVRKSEMSTWAMVTGGEKRHPRVIFDSHVMQWVGFGWVDEGDADGNERSVLPLVIDG